jgi:hypothetical protein
MMAMLQRQLKMHPLLLELLLLSSGSSGAAQIVWGPAAVAACHPQQLRPGMHQGQKQMQGMRLRAVRVRMQGQCTAVGGTGAT